MESSSPYLEGYYLNVVNYVNTLTFLLIQNQKRVKMKVMHTSLPVHTPLPKLYHPQECSSPVGKFCIMPCNNPPPPVSMCEQCHQSEHQATMRDLSFALLRYWTRDNTWY